MKHFTSMPSLTSQTQPTPMQITFSIMILKVICIGVGWVWLLASEVWTSVESWWHESLKMRLAFCCAAHAGVCLHKAHNYLVKWHIAFIADMSSQYFAWNMCSTPSYTGNLYILSYASWCYFVADRYIISDYSGLQKAIFWEFRSCKETTR